MSETRALLGKIAALRQRLEQAQAMAREADTVAASLLAGRARQLQEQVELGTEVDAGLEAAVAPLAAPAEGPRPLPRQLTARARRVLERGRVLLARLRPLADTFDPPNEEAEAARSRSSDPLARLYRETSAIADTALRTLSLLPESTAGQLHVCEGLEATLNVVEERVDVLAAALARQEEEEGRVDRLAALLADLEAGNPVTLDAFALLADDVLDEARGGGPLRFVLVEGDAPVARKVAAHSLTTARVLARLVRHDPDLRHRAADAVLAALLHDAGMLRVPAELLSRPGPLLDEERRAVEGHCRHGAELARALAPEAPWLAEAALAHHERLDGTGYPAGLREYQLPPLVRLLAVCDVYAALCVRRMYRAARETRTALTDTLLLAEQGKLDRGHAERLLLLSFYPVGSAVELADGTVGIVIATPGNRRDVLQPARPVVTLLLDPAGHPLPAPRHVDLAHCDDHSIVRSLTPEERREVLGSRFPEWI